MAMDNTPWFVGADGAQHSAEVARALAFAGTRGSEGIIGVSDLKVQAEAVPTTTVRALTGAGLVLNRYPGGSLQTYILRNPSQTSVAITATGSGGGRTDLVVARVLDPQYEGNPPADPITFQYARIAVIQGVPSGTTTARELNLGYPAIALAKVTLPASTATITNAMITDLRRVANPRRERAMVTIFPSVTATMPTGSYASWPIALAQRPLVYVPEWATRLDIIGLISGAKYVKGDGLNDSVAGIRTGFGSTLPSENGIMIQDAEDSGGRYHYSLVGRHTIDSSLRDTSQYLNLQGVRSAGTGIWTADYQTSISIDWEFSEGAQ